LLKPPSSSVLFRNGWREIPPPVIHGKANYYVIRQFNQVVQ
jgi:hypothetical protein